MSLQEETYTLAEAFEEIDGELDDLVERWQNAEPGTPGAVALQNECNEHEAMLEGLAWLVEEYGEDAAVTVAGLDAGEFSRVEDRASAMRSQSDQPGGLPAATRNVRAGMALVDAPFLEADDGDLDACVDALTSGKPVGVVKWVAAKATDLGTVAEGNFKPVSERLVDSSTD